MTPVCPKQTGTSSTREQEGGSKLIIGTITSAESGRRRQEHLGWRGQYTIFGRCLEGARLAREPPSTTLEGTRPFSSR
ncbi:MAG: hypothetical protein HY900_11985 [Deltaproteobacteria bacterium]|nr:hypothetical protein [Deltaproteobacteria bacterium]